MPIGALYGKCFWVSGICRALSQTFAGLLHALAV